MRKEVIGLEIHVQLLCDRKLFSSSNTRFGDDPNTNVSCIDAAVPGTLPVLNIDCVKKAIKAGLVLNSKINKKSIFCRKHYSYPDLPKGYQITQNEKKILSGGYIQLLDTGERIEIQNAHIEEDAGKMIHMNGETYIDLNRAGTALLEIVTLPVLNRKNAAEFVKSLATEFRESKVCDSKLNEGSLRVDINISLTNEDGTLGTRVEIKNLNSFKYIQNAIEYEIERQSNILDSGGKIERETRLFDGKITKRMRSKEDEYDYRYLPDPNLRPLIITDKMIKEIELTIPESVYSRYTRYINLGINNEHGKVISSNFRLSNYFDDIIKSCKDITTAASVVEKVSIGSSEDNIFPLKEEMIMLIDNIYDGSIAMFNAKKIFEEIIKGKKVIQVIEENNLRQINSEEEILKLIDQCITEKDIYEYKNGNIKILQYLVGKIKRLSNDRANLSLATRLLVERLSK